jgi:AraC-like DNA-binding protein
MDRRTSTSVRPRAPERLGGTVFLWGTRILYAGPIAATRCHSHHATQIIIAPDGLDIEDGTGGRMRAHTVIIPPRMRHRHSACAHVAFMFLDGDDLTSRELSGDADPRCETWRRDTIDVELPRAPTPEQARALIASILAAVNPNQTPRPRHPAARRMCQYLDSSDRVDLATLSRKAGLSPRQMRHTFVRDVGLPMRAYLRWKRLRRAMAAVEAGASLTAAAASAGFADSAHLSRVFREHFGITPMQGLRSIRWQMLD